MAEVFLQCVLPPEDAQSSMYLLMLRELLTEILYRNVNMVADYDYVNQVGATHSALPRTPLRVSNWSTTISISRPRHDNRVYKEHDHLRCVACV
jgi:hypothetical protein